MKLKPSCSMCRAFLVAIRVAELVGILKRGSLKLPNGAQGS